MTYLDSARSFQGGKTFLALEQTIREEHQSLASQIDIVSQALRKTPFNKNEVVSALREVLKITKTHFQHENTLMEVSNFSGRLNHERDHAYLVKGLTEYIGFLVDETLPVSPALGEYLKSWVIYHERKFDYPLLEIFEPSNGCTTGYHAVP